MSELETNLLIGFVLFGVSAIALGRETLKLRRENYEMKDKILALRRGIMAVRHERATSDCVGNVITESIPFSRRQENGQE